MGFDGCVILNRIEWKGLIPPRLELGVVLDSITWESCVRVKDKQGLNLLVESLELLELLTRMLEQMGR